MSNALYYFARLTHNGLATSAPIGYLLNTISTYPREARLRRIDKYPAVLAPETVYPEGRFMQFLKYRLKDKPFEGDIREDEFAEIVGDVVEVSSAVFLDEYSLFIISQTGHSLSAKRISEYINSFLLNEDGDKWEFELISLKSKKGIENIERSGRVKSIEVSIDLADFNLFEYNRRNLRNRSLLQFVRNTVAFSKESCNGNLIKFEIKPDNRNGELLNFEAIEDFLSIFNEDSLYYKKVNITYFDIDEDSFIKADLKNYGGSLRTEFDSDFLPGDDKKLQMYRMLYRCYESNRALINGSCDQLSTNLQVTEALPELTDIISPMFLLENAAD